MMQRQLQQNKAHRERRFATTDRRGRDESHVWVKSETFIIFNDFRFLFIV